MPLDEAHPDVPLGGGVSVDQIVNLFVEARGIAWPPPLGEQFALSEAQLRLRLNAIGVDVLDEGQLRLVLIGAEQALGYMGGAMMSTGLDGRPWMTMVRSIMGRLIPYQGFDPEQIP